MKYIILSRFGQLSTIPLNKKSKQIIKNGPYQEISICDSKESAHIMIMSSLINEILEKHASDLSTENKLNLKTDITNLSVNTLYEMLEHSY